MFADHDSAAIVAVRDLAVARRFYCGTLGLTATDESAAVMTLRTGATKLVVYVSNVARPAGGNAVVWGLGDTFDAVVAQLREAGVSFEEYRQLGMTVEDGVHRTGDFAAAWFKDPDGNILHINNM